MRVALWPRRSLARSTQYVTKRVLRLSATPHAVAAGVAAGVAASFTPFMGFHFLISFVIAYFIAGNFLAAALGTFVGNPFTFPFIWIGTYGAGRFVLSGALKAPGKRVDPIAHLSELAKIDIFSDGFHGVWQALRAIWEPVLLPMTIGSIPLGILFGALFYIATRWLIVRFRAARQRRLVARADRRAAEAQTVAEAQAAAEAQSEPGEPDVAEAAANESPPTGAGEAVGDEVPLQETGQSVEATRRPDAAAERMEDNAARGAEALVEASAPPQEETAAGTPSDRSPAA